MIRTHVLALAAFVSLAAAGTAARADDITMVNESFMSTKTRAEVQAQVLQARGMPFATEVDLSTTMPAKRDSLRTRAEVRAEVGESSRRALTMWYPA
jgi:hypothetical protein